MWPRDGRGSGSSLQTGTVDGQYVVQLFKWIKQHLRIKAFYGYSENAVKTQIWTAVSIYVLIAIVKKRFALQASLHEILQILSVTLFEQVPISQAFGEAFSQNKSDVFSNQLNLWDL